MSTKGDLISILNEQHGSYVSGQVLANRLGISRNSIWKAAKALQKQGYAIESIQGIGYRLNECRDIISKDFLLSNIKYPCNVHLLDKVDSTNNYAKAIAPADVTQLVIAAEQTDGRGRLGRSFYSPADKGIYMSLAFSPEFDLNRSLFITTLSAVAVCLAIEDITGLHPKIKWVNDIYLENRKLVGILTEAESNFETGRIQRIIVGIGVNCFETELPDSLRDIVACLSPLAEKAFDRNALIAAIVNHFFDMLNNFNRENILREYKKRSLILGEQILVFNPSIAAELGRSSDRLHEGIRARAIDIDDNGGLVVEFLEGRFSRQMQTLTSGEISIRRL